MNLNNQQNDLKITELKKHILIYSHNNHRPSNTQIYERVFKNLLFCIGDKQISDISPMDIEDYKNFRIKTVKKTTVNIELRTLKAIFNLAVKWCYLDKSPAKDISQLKVPDKERQFISESDFSKLISEIKNSKFEILVYTAYYTGLRLNEIVNLQWNDVDFLDKIIHIRNKEDFITKTGKNRDIPISNKLLTLLSNYKDFIFSNKKYNINDYIFSNKDGSKHNKGYFSRKVKEFIRKAGLCETYHFHSLRHTCLSQLAKKGTGIYDLKELAGHSSIKTTELYLHTCTDSLRAAVDKL